MNTLIARLGQLETRRTAQTIWTSGKRKRAAREWVCTECRRQKQFYSDAALRWPGSSGASFGVDGGDSGRRQAASTEDAIDESRAADRNDNPEKAHLESFFSNSLSSAWSDRNGANISGAEQQSVLEQFETDGLIGSASDDHEVLQPRLKYTAFKHRDSMPDFDYKTAFPQALARGEADAVARCLFTAENARDVDFITSIPASVFSDVLRLLRPGNFVNQLASAHVELSHALAERMNLTPMWKVAWQYASMLQHLFFIRQGKGIKVGLSDYALLLESARDLGSRKMATLIWTALHEDGLTPDTECYNDYMAAVVWNGVHSAFTRQRVRVIPANMHRRQRQDKAVQDYRVGPDGVRGQALEIFGKMLRAGVVANEKSFLIVITAAAREGDMATVKILLKKTWGLDIDAILSGTSEARIRPRKIPIDSPLRPTPDLLFTLAHAFGINNDIQSALRIIDFVARSYALEVTDAVWRELFERTFVLAVNRIGTSKLDGSKVGELPPESIMRLWTTMTSEPYNVKPSIGMYNLLIANLAQRRWSSLMVQKMEEGYEIYLTHRSAADNARLKLREAVGRVRERPESDASIELLRNQWELHDVARRRDVLWLKRWVRLLLGSLAFWNRHAAQAQFITQGLPQTLWKWRHLAPTTVQYETSTGVVEFDIRTDEHMAFNAKALYFTRRRNSRLRKMSPRYVGQHWFEKDRPLKARRLRLVDEADSISEARAIQAAAANDG